MDKIRNLEDPYLLMLQKLLDILTAPEVSFTAVGTAIGLAWQIKNAINRTFPEWKAPDE